MSSRCLGDVAWHDNRERDVWQHDDDERQDERWLELDERSLVVYELQLEIDDIQQVADE